MREGADRLFSDITIDSSVELETASSDELPSEQPAAESPAAPVDRSNLIVEHRTVGLRLAQRILSRWQMRLCFDELTSLVDLSLCEAAAQFQENRGAQFSTFLFYYIRGNIVQHVERSVALKNMTALPEDDRYLGDDGDTPAQTFLRDEQRKVIKQLCCSLPLEEREVIMQRFLQELPRKTVAANLNLTTANVKSIEKRAMFQLRTLAKRMFNPEEPKKEEAPVAPIALLSNASRLGRRRRMQRPFYRPSRVLYSPLLAKPKEVVRILESGKNVVLNSDRWKYMTPTYDDLGTYRAYLVNHEVGHFLGKGGDQCAIRLDFRLIGVQHLDLVVAHQAQSVEVGGADRRPHAVYGRRLGVHHRALIEEQPDARR